MSDRKEHGDGEASRERLSLLKHRDEGFFHGSLKGRTGKEESERDINKRRAAADGGVVASGVI